MNKTVGAFIGKMTEPYPCWAEITDSRGNVIKFSHKEISDLKHLVSEMEKEAKRKIPEESR